MSLGDRADNSIDGVADVLTLTWSKMFLGR
jgi:hypothetical protein